MQYNISNTTSGHDLGTFEGSTALDAYQAMMRDAGYPDSDSAESAGLSWDAIPGDVAVVEADDLDFGMLTPPTRPGPCKSATAPEVDPVERRLEREREVAPFVADRFTMTHRAHGGHPITVTYERIGATSNFHVIAVKNSGKVKV